MKRCLILLSVITLACAGVATASVRQGQTQLELLGGFLSENGADSGPDIEAWFLSAAVGYFLTDNISVGGVAAGVWTDVAGTNTDVYGVGVAGKYHFMPTNQWVPYVGAQVLFAKVNSDAGDGDGTMWGPVAGLRYELNEYNDFYAELQYHLWSGDIGDVIDNGWGLFVGIIHQFKK